MMCSKQHGTRLVKVGDTVTVKNHPEWGKVYLSHLDSGSLAIVDLGRQGEREVQIDQLEKVVDPEPPQTTRATGYLRLRNKRRW